MKRITIARPIPPKPYNDWGEGEDRVHETERTLGLAISDNLEANLPVLKQVLQNAYPSVDFDELDPVLRKAAWYGVYYVMMVFDGIAGSTIDGAMVGWRIDAEIDSTEESSGPREIINLLPSGEGLCYAFHDWYDIEEK